jgi:DNA polymerase-3 subunit gamma/tau
MAYLVLARKYRPQTFDEVVEQAHVTQTLMNAIQQNRVAHAILFAGPRGTGKTTVARILAKAMNCRQGPTPRPCNQCRSCQEITSGSAADVFEIDGASNNSVDQIRELRENAKYMPAYSPLKIYIIDEVHMLSTPAFNALLKTLEEPPAHIMFMFATTEPHKIPVTILSRCQRYDLRRIGIESLINHMTDLCTREERVMPQESITLVAREAGGSMRDALSLLDQVMTCSEGPVTHEQVLNIVGVVDRHVIFELGEALLSGDIVRVLTAIKAVYERGQDFKKLYADLLTHIRNLLVIKVGDSSVPLIDLPESEIEGLRALVQSVSAGALNQVFKMLYREEALVRLAAEPRLAIEMVLLQICQVKPTLPMDELIENVEALRQSIIDSRFEGTAGHRGEARAPTPDNRKPARTGSDDSPTPAGQPSGTTETLPASAPEREAYWKRIVGILQSRLPALAAHLQHSSLQDLSEESLIIEVKGNEFAINRVKRGDSVAAIQQAVKEISGRSPAIVVQERSADPAVKRKKKMREKQLEQQALGHPLVSEAVELFQGKVVDVKILSSPAQSEKRHRKQ